ncbi:MAG: MBL fold metallo-hydrolase [Clostridium baratii]|uniref:MBL fold metallo-hydrolase n=1 Tax=Clostridium baratii TaxID=1561 RepID=UPI002430A79D|nr:MBL fold metallo-hydrolase [Clostridium baratii]MBS6006511.1 MBL fold metallo-hydrolase [Clostridium baratii]
MSIQIKSFPASNGESYLVKLIGKKTNNILIDCGYDSTAKYIINELEIIKENKESLDLIVFTHIDNDHINGAKKILKYIIDNQYEFGEIWYNDYLKISGVKLEDTINTDKCEFIDDVADISYKDELGIEKEGNVGYKSATSLIEYLLNKFIKDKWNKSFKGKSINVEKGNLKRILLTEEISIVLLAPFKSILYEELEEWKEYLLDNVGKEVKNEKVAAAFEKYFVVLRSEEKDVQKGKCSSQEIEEMLEYNECDTDIVNRTSISFVIEYESKKVLFLGDSSPIDIDEQLSLYITNQSSNMFDLVKVPHHGSRKNLSSKFIKKINCKNFLISTNGVMHKHPDIETIVKIIKLGNDEKKIYLNYKPNSVLEILSSLGENFEKNLVYENESKSDKKIQDVFL